LVHEAIKKRANINEKKKENDGKEKKWTNSRKLVGRQANEIVH